MAFKASDVVFAPLRPEGAVEAIVRRLGEAIGSGVLAPGDRLPPEGELAATLGVAPMTLRQALAILRDAGFVETRRGRGGGSFVRADALVAATAGAEDATALDLRELTDWRRAVSGEAAALAAARRDAGEAEAIAAADAACQAASPSAAAFRLADARFHMAVAEASRSRRLIAAEAQVQVELGDALRLTPGPAAAREASGAGHAPIVSAVAAGDAAAARLAMERHVEATYDWVVGLRLGRVK